MHEERRKYNRRDPYGLDQKNYNRTNLRRESDRAWMRRRDFRREQTRKRFAFALKQRVVQTQQKCFFVYPVLKKEKERMFKYKQHKEELDRLAKAISLTYSLDLNVPASMRLIKWQNDVQKLSKRFR